LFWSYLIISLIVFACVEYVYRANARRAADDPLRRDYHPIAVFLFFIWPLWVIAAISLFILRALAYGVFLVLFSIALVFARRPFIFIWLDRVATAVGTRLLRANMLIVRLFIPRTNPAGA
jgi:hypothetical protein